MECDVGTRTLATTEKKDRREKTQDNKRQRIDNGKSNI